MMLEETPLTHSQLRSLMQLRSEDRKMSRHMLGKDAVALVAWVDMVVEEDRAFLESAGFDWCQSDDECAGGVSDVCSSELT